MNLQESITALFKLLNLGATIRATEPGSAKIMPDGAMSGLTVTGPIIQSTEGWQCDCGATPEASSPDWRWSGCAWEHHHGYPIGHAQAKFDPSRL